jgi:molybdopterin converting factor small subunit
MATLRIPTPLRAYTGGQSEVSVNSGTAGEALSELVQQFPALQPHLFKEDGELRMFVNLFKGEENIKDLQGLQTPLGASDRLMIIPSIAGGQ